MAHFAQLDENNVVTQVIVVSNDVVTENGVESEVLGVQFCENVFGGRWKQTSYNGTIRKNYAGVGYVYRADLDAFVAPQPFPSWTLDADAKWRAPVPKPTDGFYTWDESGQVWKPVDLPKE
jgi:hypothetical protein